MKKQKRNLSVLKAGYEPERARYRAKRDERGRIPEASSLGERGKR